MGQRRGPRQCHPRQECLQRSHCDLQSMPVWGTVSMWVLKSSQGEPNTHHADPTAGTCINIDLPRPCPVLCHKPHNRMQCMNAYANKSTITPKRCQGSSMSVPPPHLVHSEHCCWHPHHSYSPPGKKSVRCDTGVIHSLKGCGVWCAGRCLQAPCSLSLPPSALHQASVEEAGGHTKTDTKC